MATQLSDLRGALTEYFARVWRDEGADDVVVGKKLGLSDSLVAKLRTGARNVTVEHLAMLAALQNVHVIAVLAEVTTIIASNMPGAASVAAPGSGRGSAVTPEIASRMTQKPSGIGAVPVRPRPPKKPPAP